MERTYILFNIYTAENNLDLRGIKLIQMIPFVAGSKEGVEKELERLIKDAKEAGRKVEEMTSQDIGKGRYFEGKVVKIEQVYGGPSIFGISSVWTKN